MLSISDNPIQLSMAHFLQPIKKLLLPETWVILCGLKNNWISLFPDVKMEEKNQMDIDNEEEKRNQVDSTNENNNNNTGTHENNYLN
jgi:hypothetical protein